MQLIMRHIGHSHISFPYRAIGLCFLTTLVGCSNWSISKPVDSIPDKPIRGKLYGKDFVPASIRWDTILLSFKSGNTSMPDGEITIWTGNRKLSEDIVITPEESAGVQVRTKVRRPGEAGSRDMIYPHGYSLRITPISVGGTEIKAKIHLSLPDYQHSYLIGAFTASTQIPRLMNSGWELKVVQGTSFSSTESPDKLVPGEEFRQNVGAYAVTLKLTELGGDRFALSVSVFGHSDPAKELARKRIEGNAPAPLDFSLPIDGVTVEGSVFIGPATGPTPVK